MANEEHILYQKFNFSSKTLLIKNAALSQYVISCVPKTMFSKKIVAVLGTHNASPLWQLTNQACLKLRYFQNNISVISCHAEKI